MKGMSIGAILRSLGSEIGRLGADLQLWMCVEFQVCTSVA